MRRKGEEQRNGRGDLERRLRINLISVKKRGGEYQRDRGHKDRSPGGETGCNVGEIRLPLRLSQKVRQRVGLKKGFLRLDGEDWVPIERQDGEAFSMRKKGGEVTRGT